MPNPKPLLISLAFTVGLFATANPTLAEVLKTEPPMGQLREGQTVFVDDGSCPVGQIKQVARHYRALTLFIIRLSNCRRVTISDSRFVTRSAKSGSVETGLSARSVLEKARPISSLWRHVTNAREVRFFWGT